MAQTARSVSRARRAARRHRRGRQGRPPTAGQALPSRCAGWRQRPLPASPGGIQASCPIRCCGASGTTRTPPGRCARTEQRRRRQPATRQRAPRRPARPAPPEAPSQRTQPRPTTAGSGPLQNRRPRSSARLHLVRGRGAMVGGGPRPKQAPARSTRPQAPSARPGADVAAGRQANSAGPPGAARPTEPVRRLQPLERRGVVDGRACLLPPGRSGPAATRHVPVPGHAGADRRAGAHARGGRGTPASGRATIPPRRRRHRRRGSPMAARLHVHVRRRLSRRSSDPPGAPRVAAAAPTRPLAIAS